MGQGALLPAARGKVAAEQAEARGVQPGMWPVPGLGK